MRKGTLLSFLPILIGCVCVLITNRTLLSSSFFRPHDWTHGARIVEMNRSLADGEFPVRWSKNFGFGYGMPLFNFYAPLPYYIAQVPYGLTHDVVLSIKFLYFLNGAFAFAGMYLLARDLWQQKTNTHVSVSGIIAATAFSFSTYRALDLYVRGAIGEVFAMALLPFALWGMLQIVRGAISGVLITSVSLAGVLLSHNLIGMISVPLTLFWGGVLLVLERQRKQVSHPAIFVTIAVLLTIGLSAFYTLPAYIEKDATRVEQTITTGDFDFHKHFVAFRQLFVGVWGYGASGADLYDDVSFALGTAAWFLLAISFVLVLRKGSTMQKKLFSIIFLFFVFSLVMTTNKSLPIWEHASVLKFMQFPWRFLTFAHVFLSLMIGGITLGAQTKRMGYILGLLTLGMFFVFQAKFFVPEKMLEHADDFYNTSEAFIQTTVSTTLNDYLPHDFTSTDPPWPPEARIEDPSGASSITILRNASNKLSARVQCEEECVLLFNVFRFPGWEATIDGQKATLYAESVFPTYQLEVPPGAHIVTLQLRNTAIRTLGNLVTLLSIGSFIGYGLYQIKSRR